MQQVKLTARQEQIFKLIAAGKSNAQIAEELSITRDSMKDHIRNIYSRIKIHRRVDAITWWRTNQETG